MSGEKGPPWWRASGENRGYVPSILDVFPGTRFEVEYTDREGKRKTTEITAKGKLEAASIVLETLASAIIRVKPLIPGSHRKGWHDGKSSGV